MNVKELKTLLKENKIHFYEYWDKKRLIALANEHDLLPKKDINYDKLKTIKQNLRKVSLTDVETDKINTFPSIYKAAKFIDRAPQTIIYRDGKVWNKKYEVATL